MISQKSEDSQNSKHFSKAEINKIMCDLILRESYVIRDRLQPIREDLIKQYPEWSICEINKEARFLYQQAIKRL